MRLIDADKLIEKLKSYAECDWNKSLYTMLPSVVDDCIEFVDEQPTAYDIDKVVEELEKELEKGNIAIDFGEFRLFEIIKHGSASNDVCEWKIFDNSLTGEPQWVYETTCGKYVGEEHTSKAFVYCPYCGKKIKVVE